MDEQVKTLLNFLKRFKKDNRLTDEEFAAQLAEGILDGQDDDPCLPETFYEQFVDIVRETHKQLNNRMQERYMRS